MRLLAIDTAAEACSVGIAADDEPAVFVSEIIGRGHAERLVGMINEAMGEARLAYKDLDRIAVTLGPGSFTGVRVGIAAARGLALVIGCPVAGVGTLAVHAEAARAIAGARPVLVAIDARRSEVYAQAFGSDGAPIGEPAVGSPSYFAERADKGTILAGSGAPLIAAEIGPDAEGLIVHRQSVPDIRALMKLGKAATDPFSPPRPLYLRAPDAKPQTAAAVARR